MRAIVILKIVKNRKSKSLQKPKKADSRWLFHSL